MSAYIPPPLSRRSFFSSSLSLGAAAATTALPGLTEENTSPQLGPIVGHTEADQAVLWMRAATARGLMLEIKPVGGKARPLALKARADAQNDLCVKWVVKDLQASTKYEYRILTDDGKALEAPEQVFTTPPAPGQPAKVRLAISSCAKEDKGSREVWQRMAAENVDAVILIGDTPYIDSTELEKQTQRHREFAAVEEYQHLLRARPCWWTWDDHDFGGNDSCGLMVGKENSRLAFTRYRPQVSYGDGKDGIYTSFRFGPVEVFMLDTRWFSMTEASPGTPHKPTLLGAAQWKWLQEKLLASTATFKLLACGMIWDSKESKERDDWGTYMHERKALEKFIGDNKIPGVVYVGGDIHASRVLRYPTKKAAGYELVQFIASPIHGSTIPTLNIYHPDLVRSAVEPHVFLIMEADTTVSPPRLTGELVNRHGERVFTYHLDATELTPA